MTPTNFLKKNMKHVVSRVIWWGKNIIHKNWQTVVWVKVDCNTKKIQPSSLLATNSFKQLFIDEELLQLGKSTKFSNVGWN